jgi:putative heme-binding domain-containing protein
LGPNIQPRQILSLKGDTARGKLIYFSDTARCRACHEHTDASKSLGPTLADINKKYPEASEMLLHVLDPSRKIDDRFATHVVLANDGQIVTGLLLAEDATAIKLKTSDMKEIRIMRSDIAEVKKSPKSLMPDAILSDLTAQEAADLLSYIRGF